MAANNYEKGGKKEALKIHLIYPIKSHNNDFIHKNKYLKMFINYIFLRKRLFEANQDEKENSQKHRGISNLCCI